MQRALVPLSLDFFAIKFRAGGKTAPQYDILLMKAEKKPKIILQLNYLKPAGKGGAPCPK
jgi:hypothetical protein